MEFVENFENQVVSPVENEPLEINIPENISQKNIVVEVEVDEPTATQIEINNESVEDEQCLELNRKQIMQCPDIDSSIKIETKQLISTKTTAEYTVELLKEEDKAVVHEIKFLQKEKHEIVSKQNQFLFSLEKDNFQIKGLEKVLSNNEQIVAKLSENIDKLNQLSEDRKQRFEILFKKVKLQREHIVSRTKFFKDELDKSNIEIESLKNRLKNCDDFYDEEDLKNKNIILQKEVDEVEKNMADLQSKLDEIKSRNKKKEDDIAERKEQLQNDLKIAEKEVEELKLTREESKIKNEENLKKLQNQKLVANQKLEELKLKKSELGKKNHQVLESIGKMENANAIYENKIDELKNITQTLQGELEQKRELQKCKMETLQENFNKSCEILDNKTKNLSIIVDEKIKLEANFGQLKIDCLGKTDELKMKLNQLNDLKESLNNNRKIEDGKKSGIAANWEKIDEMKRDLEKILGDIETTRDKVAGKKDEIEKLSTDHELFLQKKLNENQTKLEDLKKQMDYAAASGEYFDENISKLHQEINKAESAVQMVELEKSTKMQEEKQNLLNERQKQIADLKEEIKKLAGNARASCSSQEAKKGGILKPPGNKTPPKKVTFVDITGDSSQSTVENENIHREESNNKVIEPTSVDDLLMKLTEKVLVEDLEATPKAD